MWWSLFLSDSRIMMFVFMSIIWATQAGWKIIGRRYLWQIATFNTFLAAIALTFGEYGMIFIGIIFIAIVFLTYITIKLL